MWYSIFNCVEEYINKTSILTLPLRLYAVYRRKKEILIPYCEADTFAGVAVTSSGLAFRGITALRTIVMSRLMPSDIIAMYIEPMAVGYAEVTSFPKWFARSTRETP